ncbi:MAG: hypothetical protein CVU89_01245 [Firmicutes bacterium HGW-Firmicutes-14]|nr:MAG: hypothetical protein CVU89_01245 [Firmicutes bacterium HGW-Firmicutes-14]
MEKDIATIAGQRDIAVGSMVLGLFVSLVSYLLFSRELAAGIMFSVVLTVANYQVLVFILSLAIGFLPGAAKRPAGTGVPILRQIALLLYHMRFWLIVAVLYLIIPKSSMTFVIGTLIGFIIPKFVMGAALITGRGKEWWLNIDPRTEKEPEREKIEPGQEYLFRNPFEHDPIEEELKKSKTRVKRVK